MKQIPSNPRLMWMVLLSIVLHVVVLRWWAFPVQPPPRKRVTRVVRLYKSQPKRPKPKPRKRLRPKPLPQTKPLPPRLRQRKRKKVRRKPSKIRKKRSRSRRKKRRRSKRKKSRSARLARRSQRPPMLREENRPNVRSQRPKPLPTPTKPQAKRRRTERSYRNLDLRPKRLPKIAGTRGGKGKKGPLKAWEGNDRFGRRMRAYHRRWKEWLKDYSGLTDAFFGTAQIRLDRCLETKIVGDLQKHLSYGEIASPVLGPKWKGHFVMQWDRQGKVRVSLRKSWGHRKLDNVLTTWATRCMKRVSIPKRLKGKRLWMLTQTKVFARVNASLGKIIGLEEYRDPQTGGLKWKFTHWGQVLINANTLFLRQRIDP